MEFFYVIIASTEKSKYMGQKLHDLFSSGSKQTYTDIKFELMSLDKDPPVTLNADLLVVYDNNTLFAASVKYESLPPIVYICNNERDCPTNMPSLSKVIVIDDRIKKLFLDMPAEKLMYSQLDINVNDNITLNRSRSEVKRILYVLGNETILYVKRVVKLFNQNTHLNFVIQVNPLQKFLLEDCCNDNIKLLEVLDSDRNDLVIGSGNVIHSAILEGMPAFVLGTNGLGGLVRTENLRDFYRTHFKGRIGGTDGEDIPFRLLKIMFDEAINSINNQHQVCDADLVKEVLIRSNTNGVLECLQAFINTINNSKAYSDYSLFRLFKIKTYSNIVFINIDNQKECLIIDAQTEKLIGMLDNDEREIISMCSHGCTFEDLSRKFSDFDFEQLKSFLIEMKENNVIYLYQ